MDEIKRDRPPFTCLEDAVQDDLTLGKEDLLVYWVLCRHAGNESREAWPGMKRIAKLARCSERRARYAIQALDGRGYLSVERRKNGKKNETNLYRILSAYTWMKKDPDEPGGTAPGAGGVLHSVQEGTAPSAGELNSENYTQTTKRVLNYLWIVKKIKLPRSMELSASPGRVDLVKDRMKEGATPDDFRQAIEAKHCDTSEHWTKNYGRYMTPETLFRKSNFWRYRELWTSGIRKRVQKEIRQLNGQPMVKHFQMPVAAERIPGVQVTKILDETLDPRIREQMK